MNGLPLGWVQSTGDRLFTFVTSGSRGWARYYSDDGARFIRIGNLRRIAISPDFTDLQRVSPPSGTEGTRTQVMPNDILISITADLGRVALMSEVNEVTYINQHVALARPVEEINHRYLAWYLSSSLAQQQWGRYQRGVTRLGLGLDDIRSVEVPLAPLPEQQRIVDAIEEAFTRIDVGALGLERARRQLDRMRNAIRFAATRGELVDQDPGDEPAASMIARVRPTGRFRGTKDLPPGLGPLPSGWTWALMGALAQRLTVGHVGTMKDEYVADGIPFLRSQNVREDRFDPSGLRYISSEFHARLRKSRLLPGDVVIVRSGNVGTACVVPDSLGVANCADLVIVQRPEAVDPYYAALYMNSLARSRVRAGRVGVALTHFNTQSVAELPVPVPPLDEQKRIVAEAQRLMSKVDALEAQLGGCLKKAKGLRSSILAAAFSGRLTQQDPEDEPGTVLLERIESGHATTNGRPTVARIRNTRNRQQKVTA